MGFVPFNYQIWRDMKVDKDATRRLAEAAGIVNTINGGTIFPTFNTTTEKDHYRLEVSVPTVEPDDLKVEVTGSDLMIYQNVHVNAYTLPNVLGMIKISADVELENIHAEFEDDLLVVIMPFSEMSGGFQKEIDIYRH
ncbi:Molecular chaperone IbpA, HSP20 family [Ekhidna lutea]|uniref:Molecular chaperone IbpA, HSP20 family n=2 Tax=Ekhidna lutea TaxID=447679 RepID=A0A239ETL2_EKHLU|nr:Molecular chaperone IbpA, HSP20 family [Ekhidna lutea]